MAVAVLHPDLEAAEALVEEREERRQPLVVDLRLASRSIRRCFDTDGRLIAGNSAAS
jgi:hypothetical protein